MMKPGEIAKAAVKEAAMEADSIETDNGYMPRGGVRCVWGRVGGS